MTTTTAPLAATIKETLGIDISSEQLEMLLSSFNKHKERHVTMVVTDIDSPWYAVERICNAFDVSNGKPYHPAVDYSMGFLLAEVELFYRQNRYRLVEVSPEQIRPIDQNLCDLLVSVAEPVDTHQTPWFRGMSPDNVEAFLDSLYREGCMFKVIA